MYSNVYGANTVLYDDAAQTVTNKTIDCDANTFSGQCGESSQGVVVGTVATMLGLSPSEGWRFDVNDGATRTDCATGGGGFDVECCYHDSTWEHCIAGTEPETVLGTTIAGRSLGWDNANRQINAEEETYVYESAVGFTNPDATHDFFFDELQYAVTFKSIYCKTLVGTVDLDVTIAGSDINGTDITCNTTGVLDDSLGGDTAGAVGEEVKLEITSVASSPTYLYLELNGTYDD